MKIDRYVRLTVCIVFTVCAVMGISLGYPFNALPEYSPFILSGFRVLLFSLILLRLYTGRFALAMLWGLEHKKTLYKIWWLWGVICILGLLGVAWPLIAIINFLIFLIVFLRSKYYSIEEIYFQIACFFAVFLPLDGALYVDTGFGITIFNDYIYASSVTVVVINAYAWVLSLLLLSAALEKSLLPTWRKGLSFYYFVALPHLIRPKFHWLRRYKILCQCASWATVLGQGSLFLLYLVPSLIPIVLFKQMFFGLLLILVVDLSFIGQIFIVQFLLFFTLSIHGYLGVNVNEVEISLVAVVLMSLLLFISAVYVLLFDSINVKSKVGMIVQKLMKLSTGMVPIKVFGDAHLFGLYVYKVISRHSDNSLPAFSEVGGAGRLQSWHSRYYQGAMYPVTDACLSMGFRGDLPRDRQDKLNDLIGSAHDFCKVTLGTQAEEGAKITYSIVVKAINPSDGYVSNSDDWIDEDWTPIYQGVIEVVDDLQSRLVKSCWLETPPVVVKSTRSY